MLVFSSFLLFPGKIVHFLFKLFEIIMVMTMTGRMAVLKSLSSRNEQLSNIGNDNNWRKKWQKKRSVDPFTLVFLDLNELAVMSSLSKLFFFWKKTENWNQKWERTKLKLHLFQSSNFLRAIPTILKFEWPDNDDDEEKKIHFGYFVFKRRTRRTAHVNESKVVNRNSGRSYADAYSVSSLFFSAHARFAFQFTLHCTTMEICATFSVHCIHFDVHFISVLLLLIFISVFRTKWKWS